MYNLRDGYLDIGYNLSLVIYWELVESMSKQIAAVMQSKVGATRYWEDGYKMFWLFNVSQEYSEEQWIAENNNVQNFLCFLLFLFVCVFNPLPRQQAHFHMQTIGLNLTTQLFACVCV